MEPVTLGMSSFNSGVTIGLPYYYNYTKHDDIPDSALILKKLKLFRNPFKAETATAQREEQTPCQKSSNGPKFEILKVFDRKSEDGLELMETLVFSDNAKRFSIARELFLADSYRVPVNVGVIFLAGFTAMTISEWSVNYFKQKKKLVSVRIPYYLLSALYGFVLYKTIKGESDKHFFIQARDQAKSLGESYAKGAEEYFAKTKLRRDILTRRPEPDTDY